MKNYLLLAVLLLAFGNSTSAQNTDFPKNKQFSASPEQIIKDYALLKSPAERENALDMVHSQGIKPTLSNINFFRQLLVTQGSPNELITAIQILGKLHAYGDPHGMNALITRDIRGFLYSGNDKVSRAAILTLSRMTFVDDLVDILSYAKARNLISRDEFYGEIAHSIRYAPKQRQAQLASVLAAGNNRYGADVIAMSLGDVSIVRALYPETQAALATMLKANEPNFPMAIGAYGHIDAARYSMWLHASANLSEKLSNDSYHNFILKQLSSNIDPRKIIAFLSSTEGGFLITKMRGDKQLKEAIIRAADYADSFPQNRDVSDLVQLINRSMMDTTKR